MSAATALRFDVGHITLPQIEQAAGILGINPGDLALLLAEHQRQQSAREAAPEVYAALDKGNMPEAAAAVLKWLEPCP